MNYRNLISVELVEIKVFKHFKLASHPIESSDCESCGELLTKLLSDLKINTSAVSLFSLFDPSTDIYIPFWKPLSDFKSKLKQGVLQLRFKPGTLIALMPSRVSSDPLEYVIGKEAVALIIYEVVDLVLSTYANVYLIKNIIPFLKGIAGVLWMLEESGENVGNICSKYYYKAYNACYNRLTEVLMYCFPKGHSKILRQFEALAQAKDNHEAYLRTFFQTIWNVEEIKDKFRSCRTIDNKDKYIVCETGLKRNSIEYFSWNQAHKAEYNGDLTIKVHVEKSLTSREAIKLIRCKHRSEAESLFDLIVSNLQLYHWGRCEYYVCGKPVELTVLRLQNRWEIFNHSCEANYFLSEDNHFLLRLSARDCHLARVIRRYEGQIQEEDLDVTVEDNSLSVQGTVVEEVRALEQLMRTVLSSDAELVLVTPNYTTAKIGNPYKSYLHDGDDRRVQYLEKDDFQHLPNCGEKVEDESKTSVALWKKKSCYVFLKEYRGRNVQDFLNMASTVSKWRHEAILEVFGVIISPIVAMVHEKYFLSLHEYLLYAERSHPITLEYLRVVLERMLTALNYLHRFLNVPHGNVTLGNILVFQNVDNARLVKLTDPGCHVDMTTDYQPSLSVHRDRLAKDIAELSRAIMLSVRFAPNSAHSSHGESKCPKSFLDLLQEELCFKTAKDGIKCVQDYAPETEGERGTVVVPVDKNIKAPPECTEKGKGVTLCLPDKGLLLKPGQLTTSYRPKDVLGKGNFSTVFRGMLRDDEGMHEKPVAVKVLKNSVEHSTLIKEVEVLYKLHHENVLRILKVDDATGISGNYCIITDLGISNLVNHLQENKAKLSLAELRHYALQICKGMVYLSDEMTIMHRDLACRNIVLFEGNILKISDFGLAKQLEDNKEGYRPTTRTEMCIYWMPPEVLISDNFTKQVDIWSFGVVLWEIFTFGLSPIEEYHRRFDIESKGSKQASDLGLVLKNKNNRLSRPKVLQEDKCGVYQCMQKCWQCKVSDRPENFRELQQQVQDWNFSQ